MIESEFSYIAIDGPIGAGKTTLAKRLAASYGGQTLLEAPEDNPFLPRFYQNTRANALSTQLSFLLQRVEQLKNLHQADMFAPVRVADFLLEKDRLFAELTLDPDELDLYMKVYRRLTEDLMRPELVIYLQAPVDVLLSRIANRGIAYEAAIDRDYLDRLVAAYTHFFFNFEDVPLVIVNAAEIDLANNDAHYRTLFEHLQTVRRGRHYLNPLPF